MHDQQSSRNFSIDIIRSLSALEVTAGHLRSFMFSGAEPDSSPLWKAFIIATAQGHNAVIIFFVLSGYLVGKHVSERLERDRWSWGDYAIKRLTRLWIVLLPALVLTAILDAVGSNLFKGSLYLGLLGPATYGGSTPNAGEMIANRTASTFLGNIFFLQNGILVAAYGVNGPLWSLANEFWYYVLFPLGYYATRSRAAMKKRCLCGAAFVAICVALPAHILIYGLIWLQGFFVAAAEPRCDRIIGRPVTKIAAFAASAILVSSFYIIPRFGNFSTMTSDFMTSSLFSFAFLFIICSKMTADHLKGMIFSLSDMSYTLYLTHFPLMAAILCAISNNGKFKPSLISTMIYTLILALSLGYAFSIYLIFERNTGRVQTKLLNLLHAR